MNAPTPQPPTCKRCGAELEQDMNGIPSCRPCRRAAARTPDHDRYGRFLVAAISQRTPNPEED